MSIAVKILEVVLKNREVLMQKQEGLFLMNVLNQSIETIQQAIVDVRPSSCPVGIECRLPVRLPHGCVNRRRENSMGQTGPMHK
ncbi:MAG: hypothetical protein MK102_15130 [Fuerstiella sp.]|nr:hypothetical protein [Fuerstiella sp.]